MTTPPPPSDTPVPTHHLGGICTRLDGVVELMFHPVTDDPDVPDDAEFVVVLDAKCAETLKAWVGQ